MLGGKKESLHVAIKPVSEAQNPSYLPPVKPGEQTHGAFASRLFYGSLNHSKDSSLH